MQVEDLDISPSKIGESAQRIVDRAIEESRRREHPVLTNEHLPGICAGRWDMFAEVMRDIDQNLHTILQAIEDTLQVMPSVSGRDMRARRRPSSCSSSRCTMRAAPCARPGDRSRRRVPAVFEETGGACVDPREHGVSRTLCGAPQRADARHGASARAAKTLSSCRRSQAFRHQLGPARARQNSAFSAATVKNPAGARVSATASARTR